MMIEMSTLGRHRPGGLMLFARAVVAAALPAMLLAAPALAHTGAGGAGGFVSGFAHPLFGPDHVGARGAGGVGGGGWGALLGQPAIWLLPVVFPLVMAFGGVLGIVGVPIPSVETGIAAS